MRNRRWIHSSSLWKIFLVSARPKYCFQPNKYTRSSPTTWSRFRPLFRLVICRTRALKPFRALAPTRSLTTRPLATQKL